MHKIGIIAAMKPEMEQLVLEMTGTKVNKLGLTFYSGQINNKDVVVCQCGVGKVASAMAATVLINDFNCDFLINTGIAGGVDLNTRDVVVGCRLGYHDFDTTLFGYEYGQVPGYERFFKPKEANIKLVTTILDNLNIDYKVCPIYSGDKFVSSLDVLDKIDEKNGYAVEMEGASIAQVATKANVDFIVIRYISDCIGSESQIDDYLAFENEMAMRSSKVCLKIVNNIE